MSDHVMRAKFQVSHVEVFEACEVLHLYAVSRSDGYPEDGSDEDNTYAKFSPAGTLTLTVANPALFGKFKAGQKFYMDFSSAK